MSNAVLRQYIYHCTCINMLLYVYVVCHHSVTRQCVTLFVRATFKVNGKPPILGSRSSLTPWPIDLIFETGDFLGDMTPHDKKCTKDPARPARQRVKIKVGSRCILTFLWQELQSGGLFPTFCLKTPRAPSQGRLPLLMVMRYFSKTTTGLFPFILLFTTPTSI